MKSSLLKIISILTVLAVISTCVCTTFASSKKGDIDSSGSVNSSDAQIILKYAVGYPSEYDEDELDIDEDGKITSMDALTVLQIAVGIITPEESSTNDTTEATEEPTTQESTTQEEITHPSNKADIILAYNTAVNKAVDKKAGYTKTRTAVLGKLEGAESLMKLSIVKEAINDFLGIGEKTFTNKKGSAEYLLKASLNDTDVKTASLKVEDNIYTITLELADGRSTAPTVSDTSPLIRSGILFGTDYTNTDYDYKSSENIYTGINSTGQATVKSVTQDTKNTVVKAEIDYTTGKIISLSINWSWQAKLTDIKYSIMKVSGTGNADTSVTYTDFKW